MRPMNLRKGIQLSIVCIPLVFIVIRCSTIKTSPGKTEELSNDSIQVTQIEADSLFDSYQRIYILRLDKKLLNKYTIGIGYSNPELETTSQIAKRNNAVAAINGVFFDMDNGGSVTYFEKNDSVIHKTIPSELKWAKIDSLINGAIILTKRNNLVIKSANTDLYYERSKNEFFVIRSGPLLLKNSIPQTIAVNFRSHRNPRTCLCKTKELILFITIDGRAETADGMTLIELQKYLYDLGCIDAINLDGGGSTTMWTKNKGVVNKPSDKDGERPVANAILILENE